MSRRGKERERGGRREEVREEEVGMHSLCGCLSRGAVAEPGYRHLDNWNRLLQ